jgi:hypothetical protein
VRLRAVVPTRGIEDIIADDAVVKQLQEIINFEKARQVLFGQWGYAAHHDTTRHDATRHTRHPAAVC